MCRYCNCRPYFVFWDYLRVAGRYLLKPCVCRVLNKKKNISDAGSLRFLQPFANVRRNTISRSRELEVTKAKKTANEITRKRIYYHALRMEKCN